MRRLRHRRQYAEAELNITAFMNLMVILVPFLLVTAVFSRIAIIELTLPSDASGAEPPPERELQLEITVRSDRIEVADRGGAPIVIRNRDGSYNLKSLGDVLKRIKSEYPDKNDATILLEPEISYEVMVQVMDVIRVAPVVQAASVQWVELFPAISVGDAPPRGKGA